MNPLLEFLPGRQRRAAILLALGLLLPFRLQAEPSDEEKSELKTATQSYRDGAFDLADDRLATLLKKFPKTELLPQVELLQAQALYQLGRSDEAFAAFTLPIDQVPENLRSDTLFWQAESLLDLERWPEAEQKYRALLALKNTPDRDASAHLGLAWALFKEGRENDATPLIQNLIKADPAGTAGRQAQLLQAKIQLAHAIYQDAIAALQALLAANPPAALAFQADYWLGAAYEANAQYDLAAASFQKITGDLTPANPPAAPVNAFPKSLVAQAWLGLGRVESQLHQEDLAMQAYGQAYQLTESSRVQMDAFRAFLESARAAGQLPEGVAKLQDFAKSSTDAAPAALLAIGDVLAEDGQDDKAIGILESMLVAYGKSPWVPAADYQLGLLYARGNKPDAALSALQNCLASAPDPELLRTARFELGLILLNQKKDYAGAATQFAQLSTGNDSLAENAAYNFLLAQAALNKSDIFLKAVADFTKRFPKSSYLKKIALAEGLLLAQSNKPDDAIVVYQKAINQPGGGPDQEELLRELADLQYQTNDLSGAVQTYHMIMSQFPDDALIPAQRAILVSYEMKKLTDDQTEQALVALLQKSGKSPDAAEAWFRLGEFYFYRQDYVKAQDAFQQLTTAYPSSTYAADAYFFAGRAAAAHIDYAAALALLDKVPDGSPFKSDARLWEGRVYQQQLNFVQACTLADTVLATEKTGWRFVAANLLKGQCLFDMASKEPSLYPQAVAAFDQIWKGQEGSVSERNEAAVSSAKCLEKMGETDKAMAIYLDVLYDRTAAPGTNPPTPPITTSAPDSFWQIKAGAEAGRIREAQQDWRGAIEIYKRLEQIGGPHQQEFHDLENKLRRDNYIYE
jgi:tetratricopeptide (TPR) repeat protein